MNRTKTDLLTLAIVLVAFGFFLPDESHAVIPDDDNDYPSSAEVLIEHTVDGNPLAGDDAVFNLRGSYRFLSGDVGLEASIGYAEPTSEFVNNLGGDAKLLFLDLSVVWYLNYEYLNRYERKNGKPWHRNSRIKPELIFFGGPGFATLRVDDAFPNFPLSDASRDFFTVNAGFGAKLHWLRDDSEKGWDHHTSRFYFRPEIRARWFAGGSGEIDWGVGLAFGYSFGYRPSRLSLRLKAEEACKEIDQYLTSDEVKAILEGKGQSIRQSDGLYRRMMAYREGLEDLKARTVTCGAKCDGFGSCLDDRIEQLNEAIIDLKPSDD